MLNETRFYCPECDEGLNLPEMQMPSRRSFLRVAGATTAAAAIGGTRLALGDETPAKAAAKPAEGIIRELYSTYSEEQKRDLVLPYDHMTDGKLTRQRTFNSPVNGKRIADVFTKPQQDLAKQALVAILSGNDALERLSRHGKWDSSGSLEGCGAMIFGDPAENGKFAWVFAGHHLTLRCDGNSEPGAAFGGPIYYGHSAGGYNKENVYLYQTEQVTKVFEALDGKQQAKALSQNNPGDGLGGTQPTNPRHGIAYSELSDDQKKLVEETMRTLLGPFRQEDVDEVMSIVKSGGGMDQIHVAFYEDSGINDGHRWHFWRVEGPGFAWNYRVLPHVHCFANILSA